MRRRGISGIATSGAENALHIVRHNSASRSFLHIVTQKSGSRNSLPSVIQKSESRSLSTMRSPGDRRFRAAMWQLTWQTNEPATRNVHSVHGVAVDALRSPTVRAGEVSRTISRKLPTDMSQRAKRRWRRSLRAGAEARPGTRRSLARPLSAKPDIAADVAVGPLLP